MQSDPKSPTINPVLIKWFHSKLINTTDDDTVTLDEKPIDSLQIVGRVILFSIETSKVFIKLEDGTGILDFVVNKRIDEDVPRILKNIDLNSKSSYLRVVFSPQVYKGKINNVVSKIDVVKDFNLITYHFLNVLYAMKYRNDGISANIRYEKYLKIAL